MARVGDQAAAAIVIAAAAIEATLASLALFVRRTPAPGATSRDAKEEIRLRLGRWLALSLEFALAADILRTAVAPTWDEIGKLAAIAVLRTALNFFLQREIDSAQARHGRAVPELILHRPEPFRDRRIRNANRRKENGGTLDDLACADTSPLSHGQIPQGIRFRDLP